MEYGLRVKKLFVLFTIFCYFLTASAFDEVSFSGKKKYYGPVDQNTFVFTFLDDKDFAALKLKLKPVHFALLFGTSAFSAKFSKKNEVFCLSQGHNFQSCFVSSGAIIFKEISQKHFAA